MNIFIATLFSLTSVVILILIYSYTTRRKALRVSTLLFWKGKEQLQREQSLFKKFFRDNLFYLQFVIVALLLLAIIQFTLGKSFRSGSGGRIILIMDVSASMNSMEGRMSRLDIAKEKALALMQSFKNSEVMIIAAGAPVRMVLPFSRDRGKIENIIRNLEPEEATTDIHEAILRTTPYVRDGDAVYLLSDGAFKGLSSVINETSNLFFIPVGGRGENAGIQKLEIHEHDDGMHTSVVLLVKNFGRNALKSTVDLFVNGTVVDSQRIEIPGGQERDVFFEQVPDVPGHLKAVLNNPDSFPLDNSRYLVRSLPQTVSIILVTEQNYFLRRFLEQLEGCDLAVMSPDSYKEVSLGNQEKPYDIGIYDNYSPVHEMSRASIYINPDRDTDLVSLGNDDVAPNMLYEFREHPVMKYTDFSWVRIQRARRIKSFAGVVLLESDQSPLIFATDRAANNQVVFAFDIRDSNFPYSTNFPVFFTNLIDWLQPGRESRSGKQINTGKTFFMVLPQKFRAAKEAIVRSPDGREWRLPVKDGTFAFSHTYRTGIYKVRFENGAMEFAVNPDTSESDIAPDKRLQPDKKTGRIQHVSSMSSIEIWKIFGILAALLLAFEERMRRMAV